MAKENKCVPQELEALRKRFEEHSRRAQSYYAIMHKVRELLGSDDAASAWMEKPHPRTDGKTPAELIREGRAEEVLACIDAMRSASSE